MPLQIRIDETTAPALIFGGILILVAIGLGLYVWNVRRALEPVIANDEGATLHANRQFRRRAQVSIMLVGIGILIIVGDQLDRVLGKRPLLFLLWVVCVFVLVVWMVLMALGDWLSTITYSEIAKAKLRFERRMLEEDIRRYHASNDAQSNFSGGEGE